MEIQVNENRGIQLIGNRIKSLILKNDFVTAPASPDAEKNINKIDLDLNEVEYHDAPQNTKKIMSCTAVLSLEVECAEKDKQLSISVELEGCFISELGDEEEFKSLISLNGLAMLYSIARGAISGISALSLNGNNVIIPVLNFAAGREDSEEKGKAVDEKQ